MAGAFEGPLAGFPDGGDKRTPPSVPPPPPSRSVMGSCERLGPP